jgi:hypothetical protein
VGKGVEERSEGLRASDATSRAKIEKWPGSSFVIGMLGFGTYKNYIC